MTSSIIISKGKKGNTKLAVLRAFENYKIKSIKYK